jgi:hypothetical protein
VTAAASRTHAAGSVVVTHARNDEIEGELRTDRGGVLVLRNDFDPRWILVDGGPPVASRLVDWFANGWTLRPGNRHFVLRFSPAGYLRAALAAGFLWMIALLADIVRTLSKARNRTAAH